MRSRKRLCKNCKQPLVDDGYGELIHDDGFYMCAEQEGKVAE